MLADRGVGERPVVPRSGFPRGNLLPALVDLESFFGVKDDLVVVVPFNVKTLVLTGAIAKSICLLQGIGAGARLRAWLTASG